MKRTFVRATLLTAFLLLAVAACSGNDVGGSGGAPACTTCAEVYVNGGVPCGPGPSVDAWEALARCACSGPCVGSCTQSFCISLSSDMNCGMCLATSCTAQEMACANN